MLVFSGLGSMAADRLGRRAAPGIALALPGHRGVVRRRTGSGCSRYPGARSGCPGWRGPRCCWRAGAGVAGAWACRSRSGLARTGSGGLLPWAWGLNGAFSVVATPLANLIAREAGFSRVLLCAAMLYVVALVGFPQRGRAARGSIFPHDHAPRSDRPPPARLP